MGSFWRVSKCNAVVQMTVYWNRMGYLYSPFLLWFPNYKKKLFLNPEVSLTTSDQVYYIESICLCSSTLMERTGFHAVSTLTELAQLQTTCTAWVKINICSITDMIPRSWINAGRKLEIAFPQNNNKPITYSQYYKRWCNT